jgi:Helix-turn-helix.
MKNGISQSELAAGTCSEKYVYLIEKGKRNPSAEIISQFSKRLGVNLFSYIRFLDCECPIDVSRYLEEFDLLRRKLEYGKLLEITVIAEEIVDFKKEPWCHEITINKLSNKLFVQGKAREIIDEGTSILNNQKRMELYEDQIATFCVLISTAYQMLGEFMKAKEITYFALDIAKKKMKQRLYKQIVKATFLNIMTLEYFGGEYEKTIEFGLELICYQNEMDAYEWAHFTFFYLSFAYYRANNRMEAIANYIKGLQLVVIHKRHIDVYYIRTFPEFDLLLKSEEINPNLVKQFLEIYH